jgi:NADPH-dependent curcumin reductase CurA
MTKTFSTPSNVRRRMCSRSATKSREDIVAGFAIFPETLLMLFAGENFGKLVPQIADV